MKFKQFISLGLCTAVALNSFPLSSVLAEENISRYPYTLFAGSDTEGAITINANNACINGNIATNGTIVSSSANFNVNGAITENANETTIQCFNKIDGFYFSTATVQTYFEDYFCEETNININNPIDAEGNISLIGNINISCGLKALNNVNMSGNVENTQNSAICSRLGDIIIDSENVNLNGIIYAPNGNVSITAKNLNINSVVIIADTITINCPNLNANYSSSIGEFIGIESETTVTDTEIDLFAYGEYVSETNSIKVLWDTTVPNGNFDIQASDDGLNYVSVGTVTDATEYEYAISEPFSIKYVKVIETTNNGAICESIPFMIKNNEDGIYIDFLDTDEDGLPDFFEIEIGTAVDNVDTDADGLTDYQEFIIVGTDPTIYDSVKTGVSDAEVDNDNDGLTNIDELIRTTNPNDSDTDMDGLSDYDEIFIYNTDPLVADSDEDGVDDGSEIKLGFNPNSSSTYGVPDGEYKINQTIGKESGILSFVNTEESPYSLSIEMKTNGDIEKEINVVDSGYSNTIDNDAMIGASLDISMSDFCSPEDIILRYDIKSEYTENTLNKYSSLDEFKGIKRLNVFKFDEDEGMLLPVNTQFNDDGTQLYAEVDELGTYCIMDMEIWLDNLDVDMPDNSTSTHQLRLNYPTTAQTMSNENDNNSEKTNVPIDVIFFLQINGLDNNNYYDNYEEKVCFDKNKELIKYISRELFDKYSNVNVQIITYSDTEVDMVRPFESTSYFFDSYTNMANQLHFVNYNTSIYDLKCSNRNFLLYSINNLSYRSESDKFIFNLMNSTTTGNPLTDLSSINTAISKGFIFSQITICLPYYGEPHDSKVEELIVNNKGLHTSMFNNNYSLDDDKHYNTDSTFSKALNIISSNLSQPKTTYNIIVPTKWKKITLKEELKKGGRTNSDNDSLTDWQEVIQDKVDFDMDGNVILPMFNLAEAIDNMKRYNDGGTYNFLTNPKEIKYIPYLPIKSDPTDEDTDDDGLLDDEDREPQKVFLNDLLINLKLMEKYIDEYLPDYCEHFEVELLNTDIAINILRNYGYGSDEIEFFNIIKENKEHWLKYLLTDAEQWGKWFIADGYNYPEFRDYINSKNPSILNFLRYYKLQDANENEIDFLHLLVTLGAERFGRVDANLAGWAGDLQSFIRDLKLVTHGQELTKDGLFATACDIISHYDNYREHFNDPKFPIADLLADLDAKNIACRYDKNKYLSYVLKDYYTNYCKSRFDDFVSNMGGEENLKQVTKEYVSGNQPIKHMLLHYFANKAYKAINKIDYPGYTIIDFGESPLDAIYKDNYKIVTEEESYALENLFLELIKAKGELKSENN